MLIFYSCVIPNCTPSSCYICCQHDYFDTADTDAVVAAATIVAICRRRHYRFRCRRCYQHHQGCCAPGHYLCRCHYYSLSLPSFPPPPPLPIAVNVANVAAPLAATSVAFIAICRRGPLYCRQCYSLTLLLTATVVAVNINVGNVLVLLRRQLRRSKFPPPPQPRRTRRRTRACCALLRGALFIVL